MNTLELIEPEAQQAVPGRMTLNPKGVIRLPLGLLGFEGVKDYALLANPEEGPLMWLQMLEGAKQSFRVVLASEVLPDYQPEISDQNAAFLGLTDPADAVVLNIVTFREEGPTVNLKGPIVFNRHSMIGKQVIPDNAARFETRHPLHTCLKLNLEENGAETTFIPAPVPKAPAPGETRKTWTRFPDSKLAHEYLDGLQGLEIGGSAHNTFGLRTRNVDFCGGFTNFKQLEVDLCGEWLKVDLVAPGDELPLPDNSEDFVISSHVIEHFFDPIKAIQEWLRVIRPGGYIFIIAPHKERTFDKELPRTSLQELLRRHSGKIAPPAVDNHLHHSIWITEDLLELCRHQNWNVVEYQDVDDKVGNGFTVIIQKAPEPQS